MTYKEFLLKLPKLVKGYKPAPNVRRKIAKLDLLMVVGPSGVGKTTLIKKSGFRYVPSDNTRQPRQGEKAGIDFYFRKDYQKIINEIKSGQFVQIAIDSGGDLKATRANSYPSEGIIVMAIVADVIPIFRKLGFNKTTSVFITPPSYQEWMRRLAVHQVSEKQLIKRLAEARRSFEFALADKDIHFILNDDIELAVAQLHDVLNSKDDLNREENARLVASSLMAQLPK
ncbi:MAG TPA: hypothetical protein VFB03_00555 [Candidatus Saccharimonadales bacterium]|nr:hypothetical protein [Candidatus Saccharimonadales bacterium]